MPLEPQEVIEKLQAAMEEAKATIRDLHSARADVLGFFKQQRGYIEDQLRGEVDSAVEGMIGDIRERAMERIDNVIVGIRTDWRKALGLATQGTPEED